MHAGILNYLFVFNLIKSSSTFHQETNEPHYEIEILLANDMQRIAELSFMWRDKKQLCAQNFINIHKRVFNSHINRISYRQVNFNK